MGFVRNYTEIDVAGILKDSEGSTAGGGAAVGHAEGLHELQSVGRGRASTSEHALGDRAVAERKASVGAFDGCQAQAVTWALNTRAGQNALMCLNGPKVSFIFAEIDVSSQNFRMKAAVADVPAIGPIAMPAILTQSVVSVCLKLIPVRGTLHIRTAYPRAAPSARGQHCECYYVKDGGIPQQDIPI